MDWSIDGLKTASGASGIEMDLEDMSSDKQTKVAFKKYFTSKYYFCVHQA